MSPTTLCERYLDALNRGDLDTVLSLFLPDARVSSPLYGERDVTSFYTELFADTARSETQLLHVFGNSASGSAVALHFAYDWTLANGTSVRFECVDVFELSEDRQRFAGITIIYDTAPLRAEFAANKG